MTEKRVRLRRSLAAGANATQSDEHIYNSAYAHYDQCDTRNVKGCRDVGDVPPQRSVECDVGDGPCRDDDGVDHHVRDDKQDCSDHNRKDTSNKQSCECRLVREIFPEIHKVSHLTDFRLV
jgi:hypothetical protein